MSQPDVLTTGEAGRMLRCSPRTIAKWCDSGELKSHRVFDQRRISREDLAAFIRGKGMPATWVPTIGAEVMTLGFELPDAKRVGSSLELGYLLATAPPRVIVVDVSALTQRDATALISFVDALGYKKPKCVLFTNGLAYSRSVAWDAVCRTREEVLEAILEPARA